MNQPHPLGLALVAFGMIAALGGLALARGGLFVDGYEGDVLHLIEIVTRLADGQTPHHDFMTPIGVLAVWPIALLMQAGLGFGAAVLWAQVAVAVVLAGPAIWAGWSRFTPGLAHLFVAICMVLPLALVHGEGSPNLSVSMHYNRWAWAFSFVALALALLPARRGGTWRIDGAIIGVALAITLLMKITYVVALAPAIVTALLLHGARRTLAVALLSGTVFLGLVTIATGWAYWPAYIGDLLTVATSDVRAYPGRSLGRVLAEPGFIGAHLLVLLGVVMLRQGQRRSEGVMLLILFPGLVYITYQNFGNDPQWLLLLAPVLMMVRPVSGAINGWGWNLRHGVTLTAAAMGAMIAPSFINMAHSPLRHFTEDAGEYVRVFPGSRRHGDLFITNAQAHQVNMQTIGEEAQPALVALGPLARRDPPSRLNGETLEVCILRNGLVAWFHATADALEKAGFAKGKRIVTADLLSNLPLFSEDMEWVRGGAPWRYDGVPGFDGSDYVLVPLCTVNERSRRDILQAIRASAVPLREIYRNPMFILLERA